MNIAKFDKAEVLAILYNNSIPRGLGLLQADSEEMGKEEAQELLDNTQNKYFDYLKGRVMKISLAEDELRTDLYDRDNGEGAAERLIGTLGENH